MPVIPNTNTPNLPLLSKGDGSNGSKWGQSQNGMFQITKSYCVLGPLTAYTAPGFSMSVPAGQSVSLIAVVAVLSAGTCTVAVHKNGTGITGLTAISVSTTSTGYVNPTTNPNHVADLDFFAIAWSGPSSTGDLSFDFVFAITP